jgi:lipoprotein-releasing system permease protein
MLRFELKVAWRHLISGHGQTELTVGAIAVGVLLVVFLSSLINGLQIGLFEDVVGSIPHVTIEAAVPGSKPLWQVKDAGDRGEYVTKIEKISSRKRKIQGWPRLVETIKGLPDVAGVAPSVQGSGFAGRGAKKVGAVILGVVPRMETSVVSLKRRIIEGNFDDVDQQNAAIGSKMAEDLGASLGSRIRITSNEGVTQTFRVAAIFEMGTQEADKTWVYVGLSSAQAMFKLGKDVTTVSVRGSGIFKADRISSAITSFTPLLVTNWMESNTAFLETMRMQNSAAMIVQAMTLLASAFGVASAMIVFVVQKARDIGILKSMGATCRQIRRIFILEGLGIGLGGAILGSGIGTGLCFLASSLTIPGETFGGRPATIVPMEWNGAYVVVASLVAVAMGLLSSVVPAHRASRLSPVEAIRRGL